MTSHIEYLTPSDKTASVQYAIICQKISLDWLVFIAIKCVLLISPLLEEDSFFGHPVDARAANVELSSARSMRVCLVTHGEFIKTNSAAITR